MDPLVLGLALLVGVVLGVLGGGGSILMVPLLVYVAGLDAKQAIATSLLVVGATALIGAWPHARRGRVQWRVAGLFGAAGMAGAYLGGRLGALLPGTVLLIAFALMMIATAGAMLRDSGPPDEPADVRPSTLLVLGEGLVVGVVTGLVGAGGGFLVVPALVLFAGLSMPTAVGTSLLVIALKSGAGVAGYLAGTALDWTLAAWVIGATGLGVVIGARVVDHVPAQRLRGAFGWFVLAMAGVVLAQELPGDVVRNPLSWVVAAVVLGGFLLWTRRSTSEADAVEGSEPVESPRP